MKTKAMQNAPMPKLKGKCERPEQCIFVREPYGIIVPAGTENELSKHIMKALETMPKMIEALKTLVGSQTFDENGDYIGLNLNSTDKPSVRSAIKQAEKILSDMGIN